VKSSDGIDAEAPDRLTTKKYWNRTWSRAVEGRERAGRLRRIEALDWQMGRLLIDSVSRVQSPTTRPRILEIGCGNSIWLPYLGRETGGEIVGVDFSERGCRLAEQNLAATGVEGTIVCDDFFDYVGSNPLSFDIVLSFGFIEHFRDVTGVLSTMAKLLRPGGVLFATVPNLGGIYGPLQRLIDKEVLGQHVILRLDALAEHGRRAGLVQVETDYVGAALRFSSLNFAHASWMPTQLSRLFGRGCFELDCVISSGLRSFHRDRARPAMAPHVCLRGTRPEARAVSR
jgi:2-polyprenyl-3-methyl-5-hydroxy-6-metoxy-1,4-benzoquinol methylase